MARIETGTRARQGHKGRPVLYVLVAAIALMVIAGVGTLTWQGRNAPAPQTSGSSESKPSGSGGAGERPSNPSTPSPAQPKAQ